MRSAITVWCAGKENICSSYVGSTYELGRCGHPSLSSLPLCSNRAGACVCARVCWLLLLLLLLCGCNNPKLHLEPSWLRCGMGAAPHNLCKYQAHTHGFKSLIYTKEFSSTLARQVRDWHHMATVIQNSPSGIDPGQAPENCFRGSSSATCTFGKHPA